MSKLSFHMTGNYVLLKCKPKTHQEIQQQRTSVSQPEVCGHWGYMSTQHGDNWNTFIISKYLNRKNGYFKGKMFTLDGKGCEATENFKRKKHQVEDFAKKWSTSY